jgi:hypothetical protein
MQKSAFAILVLIIFNSVFSCVTTQNLKAVNSKSSFTPESGYIAMIFTKKVDPIAFGSRSVYAVIRQLDTGKRFFIPFGSNGEVRLISAAPGNYRFDNFIYLVGFGSVKNQDAAKKSEGVIYGAPQISGSSLVDAGFPDEFKKEFTVNAGEIMYTGDYSWETEFSLTGPGLLIQRVFIPDSQVYHAVLDKFPGLPSTIRIVSLSQ